MFSTPLPIGANMISCIQNSLQSTRQGVGFQLRLSYSPSGLPSLIHSLSVVLNGSCNIMHISAAASVSTKISKACELSQASLSYSPSICMRVRVCVFAVFLNKTYEFVSFVRDKMKQTELGEVIGTLRQERGEKGGGVGTSKESSQIQSSPWWRTAVLQACGKW